jgi:2-polyprenyl-3-methyl-5-hydroxy-6-metoxy-1,4-benzoquinol methylase
MFDAILDAFQRSDYDFRSIAHPDDPRKAQFPEWVTYYRLKWAIAQVIQPRSILEIGVRYGYSGHAFLTACPDATYLGIDLDSDISGGVKGAIDWAKQILQPFAATFLIADTQTLSTFPDQASLSGETYDLIHVDGQQDGDSSFHDLTLALSQGRYILVDGYHWTTPNFFAVNDWLLQHCDRLDWYGAIPGYAGELLIKVADRINLNPAKTSLELRDTYDRTYYTASCDGYDSFAAHNGKRLITPRLQAIATIACLKTSGRVLDLGCGRGELAYYFAQQGFSVTAIDYSPDAIVIAQQCFADEPHLRSRVELHCADVNQIDLPNQHYDLVIATDLIEHLAPEELAPLYQRIRQWLKPDGLFLVHTFPNLWYYQYHYARKRRQARALGAYLPQQPRSRDEQLMHINEQSPRVLKRQLSTVFDQVQLWFSGEEYNAIGGSLTQRFNHHQLAAAPSLYAVATAQPQPNAQPNALPNALQALLNPPPLRWWQARSLRHKIHCQIRQAPATAIASQRFIIQADLLNQSSIPLHSLGNYPIHWSYRWHDANTGQTIVPHGDRSLLLPTAVARPSERTTTYDINITAPPRTGSYRLTLTLVQEYVRWFDQPPIQLLSVAHITIV